ncbi:MAG: hypothetical protein ABIN89_24545 [Chitinophagaceae bacterium]
MNVQLPTFQEVIFTTTADKQTSYTTNIKKKALSLLEHARYNDNV